MLYPAPHGFSEVLYAVSSAATTTAAPLPGLSASPFWQLFTGVLHVCRSLRRLSR
ncbi:potassium-transporting ATPase subunit KdpA [Escherichia coli]